MKIYKRTCPDCEEEIVYKNYQQHWQAVNRNSVCKSCRTVRANKSPLRDTSREKNGTWKGYKIIPFSWFSKYFLRKGRKYPKDGNITITQVFDMWEAQEGKCKLTGLPIGWYDDNKTHTASIDRIDSTIGYFINNVQLVHKDINRMKNKYSQEYFIEMCKLVTNNK